AGRLLILSSASLFRDGIIAQPGYGHGIFLTDLVRTFANPEQLLRLRVDRRDPGPLPALSLSGRLLARIAIVGIAPALLVFFGLVLLLRRGALSVGATAIRSLRPLAIILGLAAFLGFGGVGWLGAARLDFTEGRGHTPSPVIVSLLAAAGEQGLRVQLIQSPASELPPSLRQAGETAGRLFANAGITVERWHPEELERDGTMVVLQKLGLSTLDVERVRQDTVITTEVWSGLALSIGDGQTVIPRLDGSTV
ncbi:uncharacterized protein METZ01_LOCUS460689, partial [marine metagenome]